MTEKKKTEKDWWVKGLIFENCNCQIICHGHTSFRQLCTHEKCIGHWSIHIVEGRFQEVALDDLNIIILYETPQLMIQGGWTEGLYIDQRADESQRRAIENILTGQVGGPWVVLSRFVSKRLETQFLPIQFEDQGKKKRMWVEGLFEATIENIRGKERDRDVRLENLYNVIHGSAHVIASGKTSSQDSQLPFVNDGTHALYSQFSWTGP
jgi:hypothetical protein